MVEMCERRPSMGAMMLVAVLGLAGCALDWSIDRTVGELALAIHSRRISDVKTDGESIFDG